LLETITWGTKWKRAFEKTIEWATWWWANAKIEKESLALFKLTINISKEDLEDYNWVMFTHAMDFFKEYTNLKKPISKSFFHKLIKQFVDKGLGNLWEFAINRIHETLMMILCNSKPTSLGATIIEEQNVKTFG
jgi:hypothetical protein